MSDRNESQRQAAYRRYLESLEQARRQRNASENGKKVNTAYGSAADDYADTGLLKPLKITQDEKTTQKAEICSIQNRQWMVQSSQNWKV